jgi:hypothetical protein
MDSEVKQLRVPFELKSMDAVTEGMFEGYASVFANVDSDGDVVQKGAFRKTLSEWRKRKRLPPVTWQHRLDEPLGPFHVMEEDEKGLFVQGQLLVNDIVRAREARALLKSNAIDGLSIGFLTREAKKDPKRLDVRRIITDAELFEVGIVTVQANESAKVSDVKAASFDVAKVEGLTTPKDFEELLREAGFSRSAATAFVAKCRKQSDSANEVDGQALARLHEAIKRAAIL